MARCAKTVGKDTLSRYLQDYEKFGIWIIRLYTDLVIAHRRLVLSMLMIGANIHSMLPNDSFNDIEAYLFAAKFLYRRITSHKP